MQHLSIGEQEDFKAFMTTFYFNTKHNKINEIWFYKNNLGWRKFNIYVCEKFCIFPAFL